MTDEEVTELAAALRHIRTAMAILDIAGEFAASAHLAQAEHLVKNRLSE